MNAKPTIIYYISKQSDSLSSRATAYVVRNSVFDTIEEATIEIKKHKSYDATIVEYDLTNDLVLKRIPACLLKEYGL